MRERDEYKKLTSIPQEQLKRLKLSQKAERLPKSNARLSVAIPNLALSRLGGGLASPPEEPGSGFIAVLHQTDSHSGEWPVRIHGSAGSSFRPQKLRYRISFACIPRSYSSLTHRHKQQLLQSLVALARTLRWACRNNEYSSRRLFCFALTHSAKHERNRLEQFTLYPFEGVATI